MSGDTKPPPPWERQAGESAAWFHRFHDFYMLAGPNRSIEGAWKKWRETDAKGRESLAKRPNRLWYNAASTQKWEERAASWDERELLAKRENLADSTRKMQEKHVLHLRNIFNKVILAGQKVNWDSITPGQVISFTAQLIHLERLVAGEPVSVERVQHTGADGGPIRQAVAQSVFTPTPEFMAQTMELLAKHGAFDGDEGGDDDGKSGDTDASDPPAPIEPSSEDAALGPA